MTRVVLRSGSYPAATSPCSAPLPYRGTCYGMKPQTPRPPAARPAAALGLPHHLQHLARQFAQLFVLGDVQPCDWGELRSIRTWSTRSPASRVRLEFAAEDGSESLVWALPIGIGVQSLATERGDKRGQR